MEGSEKRWGEREGTGERKNEGGKQSWNQTCELPMKTEKGSGGAD